MAQDYNWLDWKHVDVDYEFRQQLARQGFNPIGKYMVVPVMDGSEVGLSFRYYFEDVADVENFKQLMKASA